MKIYVVCLHELRPREVISVCAKSQRYQKGGNVDGSSGLKEAGKNHLRSPGPDLPLSNNLFFVLARARVITDAACRAEILHRTTLHSLTTGNFFHYQGEAIVTPPHSSSHN